jgi:NADPH2 dehydrogenase
MEGWDGTPDGRPTDLVRRRWRRFGESGAKLIWGGEAAAVRAAGRANPNQLLVSGDTVDDLAALRAELVEAHRDRFGRTDDLLVGLQLTHSGRWSQPTAVPAARDPLLDARRGGDREPITDDELDRLVDDYVTAAGHARRAGFDFVDVKHCHGYLGHELLAARDRPGRYGGDLDGRTRFLFTIVDGIRATEPGLAIGVRLSIFDEVPHRPGDDGVGVPEQPAREGFGRADDLAEPLALVDRLADAGVTLLCVTAGSPYYCPHVQRPAYFPPSDGYQPPEDPLVGVGRLLDGAAAVKRHRPDAVVVGSGYSYLQEWVAHVAQRQVAEGRVDSVGLGRMALSYHDLPADVLAGRPLDRRRLCRTFSDCTTAPRNGLVSGCWPLDDHYKSRPDRTVLAAVKKKEKADR